MNTTELPRYSGILLHPTSLPGKYGIGGFGKEAYRFVDFLVEAGQRLWQICPLGPTGYGDSPYQCFSAYAGNPLLIDPGTLADQGLIGPGDLASLEGFPDDRVDFGALIPRFTKILDTAFESFRDRIAGSLGGFDDPGTARAAGTPGSPGVPVSPDAPESADRLQTSHRTRPRRTSRNDAVLAAKFDRFRRTERYWLEDYCLFMVIKESFGGRSWEHWPEPLRRRDRGALEEIRSSHADRILFHEFLQYEFFRQWHGLRAYANANGIRIIGDMPIFCAYDSADTWSRPEVFLLDREGRPTHVAGVPPDYFSPTGQLWGNPLYDWEYLEKTEFRWWIDILKSKLHIYDYLRIDHFRGFSAYWKVRAGEATAVDGEWTPAPGKALFAAVREELGAAPIIAENLGVITPDVDELIESCGFPGMKVLQFAFDSSEENDHLPHTATRNSLMYTGTHDNTTVRGWFDRAPESDRAFALSYTNSRSRKDIHWDFIRTAMASVSAFAIFPLQDVLGLGDEARFNFPGTLGGNWTWRCTANQLDSRTAHRLAALAAVYGR